METSLPATKAQVPTPVVKEVVTITVAPKKRKYQYGVVLPLEMPMLYPLMEELFKEIGHPEGIENPEPIQNKMGRDCRQDPYASVYGCFDEDYNPVGYIWIHATKDNWETPYMDVVQVIISKDVKGWDKARIMHRFINHTVDMAERCKTQYFRLGVINDRLYKHWEKLGFKGIEIMMEFKGTSSDFRKANRQFGESRFKGG